jgi:hypothetical protein
MKRTSSNFPVPKPGGFIILIFWMILSSMEAFPQKPVDFSGKWILDNTKSSKEYVNTKSTLSITQKGNNISITSSTTQNGSKPVTKTEEYILGTSMGGRSDTRDFTTDAAWTSDKKSVSVTEDVSEIRDGVRSETKSVRTYTLSDDMKTLIVKYDDIIPENNGKHNIMIYNKQIN